MRDVDSHKGLHAARTMQSIKRHSMPRIQSSSYLDLFILQKEKCRIIKEKERLIKENERLLMKMEQIEKRIEEIDGEINKLQEVEITKQAKTDIGLEKHSFTKNTPKQGEKKEWKKMSLNY